MSAQRRTSPRRASVRPSSQPVDIARPLLVVVLLATAAVYLGLFLSSGEKRAEIYGVLWRVYLLLPDELLRFLWNEWTQGGSPTLLDRAPVYGVAAVLLAAAWGAGRLCLPRDTVAWLSRLEVHLFALAVGLNIWSLYALLVGLCGGLRYPWLFHAPMLAAIGWGAWRDWKCRRVLASAHAASANVEGGETAKNANLSSSPFRPAPSDRRALLGLALLAVPLIALYLLTAALPPWEFDVREYHLQVPKEWFQQGRIDFLPHNVYGNMPLGAEMQALLGMLWMPEPLAWWWGALAGKVVMASTAIWTALALLAFGRRYATTLAGAVAAVVYLSIPWVFHVSTVGLIDGVVGFYLWMTWHAVVVGLQALREPITDSKSSDELPASRAGGQMLAMAGFLAGSAVACKYTALIFVGLPLLGFLAWRCLRPSQFARTDTKVPRGQQRVSWRVFAMCGLLFAVACGPWFAKNAALAGNPVYPLAFKLCGGKTWNDDKNERWRRGHSPPSDSQGSRFSIRQLGSSVADLGWSNDYLSLLVWPLAMFWPLATKGRHKVWAAVAVSLLLYFLAWWLLTHRMVRFFVPALPLAAVLAGVGATWSRTSSWRFTLFAFIGVGLFLNAVAITSGRLTGYAKLLVPLEALRADDGPVKVGDEHRVDAPLRFLNRQVPAGSCALLVGDAQPFDLDVEYAYNTCWDDCLFETMIRGRTREERLKILGEHRISHILVNWLEINRYRSPGNYGFTDYVTPDLLNRELVEEQKLLRPVDVPLDEGEMDPSAAQMFEVLYD